LRGGRNRRTPRGCRQLYPPGRRPVGAGWWGWFGFFFLFFFFRVGFGFWSGLWVWFCGLGVFFGGGWERCLIPHERAAAGGEGQGDETGCGCHRSTPNMSGPRVDRAPRLEDAQHVFPESLPGRTSHWAITPRPNRGAPHVTNGLFDLSQGPVGEEDLPVDLAPGTLIPAAKRRPSSATPMHATWLLRHRCRWR